MPFHGQLPSPRLLLPILIKIFIVYIRLTRHKAASPQREPLKGNHSGSCQDCESGFLGGKMSTATLKSILGCSPEQRLGGSEAWSSRDCSYTDIYIYMYTYIHTFTYIYTYIYIHIYTHIYTHIHIHMYIQTHIYIYTFTLTYIFTQTHTHVYKHSYTHILT